MQTHYTRPLPVDMMADLIDHARRGLLDYPDQGKRCTHGCVSVACFGTQPAQWRSTLYTDGCVTSQFMSDAGPCVQILGPWAFPEGYVG